MCKAQFQQPYTHIKFFFISSSTFHFLEFNPLNHNGLTEWKMSGR